MVHSFGKRARTRDKYSKAFRSKGNPSVSRYLQNIKKGEYVDIVCDASVQKGMPFSYYHGKTGIVFNVTQHSVGVQVKKRVRNREIWKRLHVRIEHVRKSRCQEDFLRRVKDNDKAHHEAKERGEKAITKRTPEQPGGGEKVITDEVRVLEPLTFVENY
ncbi:unnamed protein product [Vitrella brassicaformis CCMP3155]|uniref:60S ribosomal protein L21 n=1 Tax=Vitrella brassicaformis (strain CCMP3155) TaxID=1169540 RepID=A0A0G4ECE8_VITBC|nr:unnamed protein product [Vitrella brassicaformis CCMP3155]|mmetsp:Transcript_53576/g.134830  ORF Transcript_53576/g.134830 Transcript_53576/m.134830 type:complete len:159 (-) Transcript_53576:449-925(-)|eukprot:CEL93389.1 unnamed protein product [Vitrella brassicaformis CCMP3155]